jgi:hypothetical protein
MGSDLYTITVEKIEEKKVSIHVEVIHPDVDMFDEDKNIALQLIVDSYWLLKNGYTWDMGINDEQAQEILKKSPYLKQLDEWLEIMHGQEVKITKAQYEEIQKSSNWQFEGKRISSLSQSGNQCTLTLETDYGAFMRLADLIILDIEVDDELLIFEVLEEGVIAHLYEGMSFASRAYDFTYYANR